MPARRKDIDAYMAEHPDVERDTARKRLNKGAKVEKPQDAEQAAKLADLEKRLRQATAERDDLKRSNRKMLADLDSARDFRDSLFGVVNTRYEDVRWPRQPVKKGRTTHVPIIFSSDKQFGEVIRASDMDGMNEYNQEVFVDRFQRMIRKSIRWCDAVADGWGAVYPQGCIYLRGGDEISGEIHAELQETNDFGAVPAVRELVRHEREGIRQLQEHFGHVHVISIPGNHGRNTIKPRFKNYAHTNYETLLAWWLQDSLEKAPGVTFDTPTSGYARFSVLGHRFEMRHGDRMGAGGGTGWIGAPAPITKGHKKIVLDAATTGSPVDYVLTGHFHTSMQTPYGWGNGSFPGYNEMARALGLDPDAAKQWLVMVPEHNLPYGIELHLSDLPRRLA